MILTQAERREAIKQIYKESAPEIPSATYIAKKLDCSKRVVYKDLKALGLPHKVGAPNGWQTFRPPDVKDYSQDILTVEGDVMVSGDWHLPFYNSFLAGKLLKIAQKFGIKKHIINGDFLDQYVFSHYDHRNKELTWSKELSIAKEVSIPLFDFFEETYILPGNHTERLMRLASFQLTFSNVMDLLGIPHDKVKLNEHNYCILKNQGEWRVTHPKSFSPIVLRVETRLASKYHQNIIGGHGHRLAIGRDESGKFIVAAGGGMMDPKYFDYIQLSDTVYPTWNPGFFMIYRGHIYGFEEDTDWELWEKL